MSEKVKNIENNKVEISGTIVSDFQYSHETFGEGFYIVHVEVPRTSGVNDVIPVMVSDRLMDVNEDYTGTEVSFAGQFRSYNRHAGNKNRCILSLFAREVEFADEIGGICNINSIYLKGYICKEPVYRKTPLGRDIADLLIAVNRPYGKSDYIPCLAWGRNAKFVSTLTIGDRVSLDGRIQSREYVKKLSDTESEKRTAYEVSINRLDKVDDEENKTVKD